MRHCENELGLAVWEGACIELADAAAAPQPSVLIIPVLAKVFDPLKPKGTWSSPMAASLILLSDTVPLLQANSTPAVVANVMLLE